jgi:hypothetical protein
VEVIVEKTEFEPSLPGLSTGVGPGDVPPAPPPPTVIGYVVAVTVTPVGVANGLAVQGAPDCFDSLKPPAPPPPACVLPPPAPPATTR